MHTKGTMNTNNRFSSLLLVIIAAVGLILPCLAGAAHAGTVNLPQTGQTTTYAAGDDGALQMGVAWPNKRFTDNGDQTMTDNLTGLVWTKNADTPTVGKCNGDTKKWQEALDYVSCLNAASYLGHNDWRLPNINELYSVVNEGVDYLEKWLNDQGFVNVKALIYWSSTTYAYYTSYAWSVFLWSGGVYNSAKSGNCYVWPVRSGQSGTFGSSAIWSSGQTKSYAAGDDGALHKGVAWPNPRFTDNNNNTVTDNLTGLVWTRDASTPTMDSCKGGNMSWQAALDYVRCLNTANYLGHKDWRLPNKKEMFSLLDRGKYDPPLPSGHPFIHVMRPYYYWSSTTDAGGTSGAWGISMLAGKVSPIVKSNSPYVWPVHSGEVGNLVNLAISLSGTGSGTVISSTGTIIWSNNTGTASYLPNTTVTLTATPNTTSTIGKWSGCDTVSSGQCTVKMMSNKTITVTFDTIKIIPRQKKR
ncbi:MAG: DUF1566 domain-containing protein [Nitrospirae bacterium]|nr:DUF1566 domain-containing protein [Nitrospirota bacterium]MBF0591104.1 DUF1566 domain-containing protein [Nitrospirota bacterium]